MRTKKATIITAEDVFNIGEILLKNWEHTVEKNKNKKNVITQEQVKHFLKSFKVTYPVKVPQSFNNYGIRICECGMKKYCDHSCVPNIITVKSKI